MTETWVSRQEAAVLLGVPLDAVDRMIRTGLLPRYRLRGRYVRLRLRDVEPLLNVPRDWLLRC
jgi:excisionase family DNA binding protein